MNLFTKLRLRQTRFTSRLIEKIGTTGPGRRARDALRAHPLAVQVLVGQRYPFVDLDAASAALAHRDLGGHLSAYNVELHRQLSVEPRPSDYAAFYHLVTRAQSMRRVFDYGGNVGNLYYYYPKFLPFPRDLAWITHDLEGVIAHGTRLATKRSATGLSFTADITAADGADLLLASGSLHYMAEPLATTLKRLSHLPTFVLINRTPLINGPTVATVQDGREFVVPCWLFSRAELKQSLAELGYRLVGEWPAAELSLRLPFHPDASAQTYSGMFLERMP